MRRRLPAAGRDRTRRAGAGSRRSAASARASNWSCSAPGNASRLRRDASSAVEIVADRAVVGRGVRERLSARARSASRRRAALVRGELLEERRVVGGIGHDGDVRRNSSPRCAPSPDRRCRCSRSRRRSVQPGSRDRLLERIEVDDDEIDRRDAVRARALRRCAGEVAAREDAAVHFRVQRLHPAVEHLGKAGVVGRLR